MNEEIRVNFEGTMFHPNYITGYCMSARAGMWIQSTQDEATKVWMLSTMLPNLKAGIILDIVNGKRKIEYEGFTLIIHPPHDEEE
jgi:hypothetical protein